MLQSKDVILRAWQQADLGKLSALRNDMALQQQLMSQPRPNAADKVVCWLKAKSDQADGVFFVIADRGSDSVRGYVQIQKMDLLHKHAELGICLASEAQGMGLGGQALALIEGYVKALFGIRKICLQVLIDNARAIRLYERHGFARVGVLREHFFQDGVFADVLIMEKYT